jgi:hypothetical protein
MSSYQVGDHQIDHPPLFMCRKHKAFLRFNRSFVDELVAWGPELQPQNLTDVAATSLGGDDKAFLTSDYLVPPKLVVFNPRRVPGHGSLPMVIVLVDRKFFGIPASYLRRRVFDGCEQCAAENDPASDASFPDYKLPPRPQKPPTQVRPAATLPPSGQPRGATPRPGPPPAAQPAKPTAVPTKSIPKRPAEPKFDVPPPPSS